MRKFTFFILCLLALGVSNIFAQTDNNPFSFQGYAVDPDGKALGNTDVTVRFSVYPQGSAVEYAEEHALTTDVFGVFVTTIGSARPNDFSKLNFSAKIYNLLVEVKKTVGGAYTTISDGQFHAVPYARSAANGVPVGSIIPFGGPVSAIPQGWLPCDGTQLNKTDYRYKQLYDVIGTAWGGAGDLFNLPDLRGYFLRGVPSGQNSDPDRSNRTALNTGGNTGDNVGSYQNDAIASHNHTGTTSTDGRHTHDNNVSGQRDVQMYTDGNWTVHDTDPTGGEPNLVATHGLAAAGDHSHTLNVNNTGGSETRSKNAAVWFIIKY